MWRWLWDSSHRIKKEDRKSLMLSFKSLVYASNEAQFDEVLECMRNDGPCTKYSNYLRYAYSCYFITVYMQMSFLYLHIFYLHYSHVTSLCGKKEAWAMCFRQYLSTGGHNTNNFCEAAMRIMKEVILQR